RLHRFGWEQLRLGSMVRSERVEDFLPRPTVAGTLSVSTNDQPAVEAEGWPGQITERNQAGVRTTRALRESREELPDFGLDNGVHLTTLRRSSPGGWKDRDRLSDRIGRSGEDLADHPAVDVGQAEIATRIAVGQSLVVQAEQVEDGGVQVVIVHL